MIYLLYIFVVLELGRGRIRRAMGKFKNNWFLFAADFITAMLWLMTGLSNRSGTGIMYGSEYFDLIISLRSGIGTLYIFEYFNLNILVW